MKHLRHFCLASALTFALAFSAFAGDINCGILSAPPIPPPPVTGQMTTGTTETSETDTSFIDPMTEFTLNILQGLLSLF